MEKARQKDIDARKKERAEEETRLKILRLKQAKEEKIAARQAEYGFYEVTLTLNLLDSRSPSPNPITLTPV